MKPMIVKRGKRNKCPPFHAQGKKQIYTTSMCWRCGGGGVGMPPPACRSQTNCFGRLHIRLGCCSHQLRVPCSPKCVWGAVLVSALLLETSIFTFAPYLVCCNMDFIASASAFCAQNVTYIARSHFDLCHFVHYFHIDEHYWAILILFKCQCLP